MKNLLKTAILSISLLSPLYSATAAKTIAVSQIVEHPSLNAIREGLLETLQESHYHDAVILYENAQGNTAAASQIAQKFAGMNVDIIVPISTPSAQPIVNAVKTTPVVFSAISDPLEAKVVANLEKPNGNVTGVMDLPPLAEQLSFIRQMIPEIKTLGIVYNPGEANSSAMIRNLEKLAKAQGIHLALSPAPKSADVTVATQSLVGRVDAIFIGTDNTVVSGLEGLIKVCLENHIPLFASDPDSVRRGAYAALAYDQRAIGQKTAELVIRVLDGEKPGDIPVSKADKTVLSFNSETAKKLNLPAGLDS